MRLLFTALTCLISVSVVGQQTYIPDDIFEQRLIDLGYDDILDNYILTENINSIQELDINNYENYTFPGFEVLNNWIPFEIPNSIQDLTGIEDFSSLIHLNVGFNELTHLDLSNNLNLEYLNCEYNDLESLFLPVNDVLYHVYARVNRLYEINVTNLPALHLLGLQYNLLTSLNVQNNQNLSILYLGYCDLSELSVCSCPLLSQLYVNNNYNFQANIDISNNALLAYFYGRATGIGCVQVESLESLPDDVYSPGGFWFDEGTTFSINCGFSTVSGCNDELACNYDATSNCNDGSCIYQELYYDCEGCLNDINQDGICDELELEGCSDLIAENYNPFVTDDDGSCEYIEGCTNPLAENYNPDSTLDNNTCIIVGCMDSEAVNYISEANEDDASCLYDLEYVNDAYYDAVNSVICPENNCPSDLDENGYVSTSDLLIFLTQFGQYCDVLDECGVINGDGSTCADQCGDPVEHYGYNYSTVQIGDQCWFSENCRYLPEVSPSSEGSETEPYYYVYNYNGTDVEAAKSTENYETYGVLYNWPAVMTEGICPSGWNISSDEEWIELEMYLGMSESEANSTGWRGSGEGYKMKATSGWNSGGNGSNSSEFSALPAGFKYSGGFGNNGSNGNWWTSSEFGSDSWERTLVYDNDDVNRSANYRIHGFSARCIKD